MSWLRKNRVLVPIDFSEASFAALIPAREFVEDASHLYVLHVLPHLHPAEPGLVWNTLDNQTRKQHVEESLHKRFNGSEYEDVQIGVAIGDPSSEIIDYAKVINADLIVISSHGHTGLSRFLLGSVAERVIRFVHCPVLVLRN
ncbi:universal stress protein [Chroococcidiopsis sp. CCMEE 29]|uniref:universal stress protein n=1 Tax=Chroococcidiopsis sp. CCMEE 29 TaxID=155894 RepID=UPI00202298DE|nr:universal stress protein [Chroococcidiopsis sp. CCMEE 29]